MQRSEIFHRACVVANFDDNLLENCLVKIGLDTMTCIRSPGSTTILLLVYEMLLGTDESILYKIKKKAGLS